MAYFISKNRTILILIIIFTSQCIFLANKASDYNLSNLTHKQLVDIFKLVDAEYNKLFDFNFEYPVGMFDDRSNEQIIQDILYCAENGEFAIDEIVSNYLHHGK